MQPTESLPRPGTLGVRRKRLGDARGRRPARTGRRTVSPTSSAVARRGGFEARGPDATCARSPLPIPAGGPPPRSGSPRSRPEQGAEERSVPESHTAPGRSTPHRDGAHRTRRRAAAATASSASKMAVEGRSLGRFRFRCAVLGGGRSRHLGGRCPHCGSLPLACMVPAREETVAERALASITVIHTRLLSGVANQIVTWSAALILPTC